MKIKSEIFVFLIIIGILFSISAVSASEIQSDITDNNTYQSNMELNQDSKNLTSNLDSEDLEDILDISQTDNTKSSSRNESTFTTLATEINQSTEELNLTHNYKFNASIDKNLTRFGLIMISVNKDKFVLNGNNHILDGAGWGATLYLQNTKGEIIINDLTFKNYNQSVIKNFGKLTLNNVNFTDLNNPDEDMIITYNSASVIVNNSSFYSNQVNHILKSEYSSIFINNSRFNGNYNKGAAIFVNRWQLIINNSSFENFTYKHGAVIDILGESLEITNSKFINTYSNLSGGAILAKYFPNTYENGPDYSNLPNYPFLFRDCIFANLSCGNDGGAIHVDMDSASKNIKKPMDVINSNFTNCSAKFGGAISILGGTLNILECNFINNTASFEGGAIYSSWTNLNITKSNFTNNIAAKNAGAIYFDKHKLTINESNLKNNKILEESFNAANAIYAHDVEIHFSDSTFDNGGVAVYADFASDSKLENIEKNDDIFLMDNHDYIVSVENKGIKINLTENEIIVDELPSRFDARDWGWTTPEKIQGNNDDCWAFATAAALETSLLKSTGIAYNLSENYIQKLQLKYYDIGDLRNSLTGFSYSGLGYALSWYGVLLVDGEYDDRGMISDTDMDVERIHVQDAVFIYTGMNDTIDQLKRAILKYGAVAVQKWVMEPEVEIPTEGEDIAIMDHDTHFMTLIGWDDNVAGPNNRTGAWITKDSLSGFTTTVYTDFPQIDYYAIVPQRVAIAYMFENTIDYHVNYQTDLTCLAGFDGNYTYYSNEFTSKYDELIGAVGTYFNETGINYSFDVFVNGNKVHSQSGISEFAGFRTIVLNKYIPVKKDDQFKVVFKSNAVPYQAWSRVHYLNDTSLVSKDGNSWIDFAPLNKTVCLKVYTVADDTRIIGNENMVVDYNGGSYFSVRAVTADGRTVGKGLEVKFNINGKTTTVKTDNDGVAKIKITQNPGKYTITTTYKGKSVENTLTIKQVLKTTKVTTKNTDKKFYLQATLKINEKSVSGKLITFKFNGKTYKAKTNKNGIAKVQIKQNVIKKLKCKTYQVKVTYLKDTIKTTVKVKQVFKANKATVKKTAKKFALKASLKINGKAAKGKVIKFKFNGKTYKAKTNKKGIAQKTLNKKVIKKLKKGKTYTFKAIYLKDTIKSSVKVK